MAIAFPDVNPIILPMGPLAISWYSLSYVAGIILGTMYCKSLILRYKLKVTVNQFDNFISWMIAGIILGGRLFYVSIYDPEKYFSNPIEILKTYEGGMSFHGGVIGVILATLIFCKRNNLNFFDVMDLVAAATPIGIFLGRIANFINCELYGRVTNMPWGVLFPPDFLSRHPSQIYESFTEGLLSFISLYYLIKRYHLIQKRMVVSGIFLILYGVFRIFCEFFRQPDELLGFIFQNINMGIAVGGITIGQILSFPFIILGILLLWLSHKKFSK
jgi:phosphatidylglycerol:prolipoprotein diacylglycerol transferase